MEDLAYPHNVMKNHNPPKKEPYIMPFKKAFLLGSLWFWGWSLSAFIWGLLT